jgi:branched-subunit amino acid transport protein
MSGTVLWLTLIVIGMLTYAIRLSFIMLFGKIEMPSFLMRALRFVPVAVLSAIILPALFLDGSRLNLSLSNARLIAGMLAVVVAWRTNNALLTIAAGMVGLWLLQVVMK